MRASNGPATAQLQALARSRDATKQVAVEHDAVVDLFQQAAEQQDNAAFSSLLTHKLAALHSMTKRLEKQLGECPYPFEHSRASLSIGTFVGHGLPMLDGIEVEVQARSSAVLNRLVTLYQRTLDRLAILAERMESAAARAAGRSVSADGPLPL